ncbi:hypothetical protein QAD02_009068 [Eretmocerus hayati]|uniref:Uncharacterized protein n=1 Tax=Eretmocerus hayati TaxID=131215 RepID=A0ACC2N890_9HYME|nr:hypothetical protein QAD02_009068 [Eretmocerus hayati]
MWKSVNIVGIVCFVCLLIIPADSTICWVNVNEDLGQNQPLILQSNSNEFLYPSKCRSGTIQLLFYQSLRTACPQDNLVVRSSKLNVSESELKCYGLSIFEVTGSTYPAKISKVNCERPPVPLAESRNTSCTNGTLARIGYSLRSGAEFVSVIDELCHNETLGQTHWAHHTLGSSSRKRQRDLGQAATFVKGPFYQNITVTPALFSKDSQRARLLELIGEQALVDRYVPNNGSDYLVEGTLAPKSDMFYRSQQDGTYFYINTIPMWKSIQDGNWKTVEEIIRKSAAKACNTLDVWTGGIGNLTITNSTGITTAITLTKDKDGKPALPVPRFAFKYVVDRKNNRGIVFVTLNDPQVKAITAEDLLCEPYAACTTTYPQFNLAFSGYTYCCTINSGSRFADLAQKLGLPSFPNVQPLF